MYAGSSDSRHEIRTPRTVWETTLERLVWAEGILLVVVLILMPL